MNDYEIVQQLITDIEWLLANDELALGHSPTHWRVIVKALRHTLTLAHPTLDPSADIGTDETAISSDLFAQPSMLEDQAGQG